MAMKTIAIAGHLATFQTSTAVEPMPSGLATAPTTGPVRTRARASAAIIATSTSVTATCSGRRFQNGRSSAVS